MITIKNLVKKYEHFTAVDNLNLNIDENEVFGLLGPNGAGKTTTIHMLATLLKPSSGTATVNGYDIVKEASKVRASIGIVFQAPSSDDMLTGYENLKVHSLLYAVQKSTREKRIEEVLELAGLTERKDDQVKKYSGVLNIVTSIFSSLFGEQLYCVVIFTLFIRRLPTHDKACL